ncbi:MAG TPA: hypothetical protein VG276_08650 [Actinomycetes bacterium]|jgi:hypothetical protein|nr:hypothetical protein [Actinomycetes bacterium]
MSWAFSLLVVAALAGLATWLVLGAVRRTARRQQQGLPPLPECPPAAGAPGSAAGMPGSGSAAGVPGSGSAAGAHGSASPAGAPGVLLEAAGARYLGTTYAPSTVRRFSGYGLLGRTVVGLALDPSGLRVDRGAAGAWCIPAEVLQGAEVATHHAGKAVYAPRVLVVDWRLGGTGLRSGFVLDEATAADWASRLDALVVR